MTREPLAIGRRTLLRGTALTSAAGLALGAGPAGTASATARSAPALVRSGRPTLTHGVQAGDVRRDGALLWSRADRPSRLIAEISRDPDFRRAVTVQGPVVTPRSDLTGEIPLRRLPSGADLHYRIRAVDLDDHRRSSAAVTGRLRTAPGRGDDVRFLWSGDIAGQGWGVNPDLGGFRIADAMRSRRADFFLCSGDNVYADGPVVESVPLPDGSTWRNLTTPAKSKVAETLDEFRGQYQYNLMADNWRAFLAETAQVVAVGRPRGDQQLVPGRDPRGRQVHREAGRRARRPRPPGLPRVRPGREDLSRPGRARLSGHPVRAPARPVRARHAHPQGPQHRQPRDRRTTAACSGSARPGGCSTRCPARGPPGR